MPRRAAAEVRRAVEYVHRAAYAYAVQFSLVSRDDAERFAAECARDEARTGRYLWDADPVAPAGLDTALHAFLGIPA
ncbi:hypothetical protein [Luteipulveratus halotolerans]|uniref:hypothetical protein n=1 Tax=Luteipulveratus halotolerans TaxID=1631356 RepID=UPI0012FA2EA6|nr:hypothetical protein [Luteipulveratus halotolerans]